jgi:hypothetical protein
MLLIRMTATYIQHSLHAWRKINSECGNNFLRSRCIFKVFILGVDYYYCKLYRNVEIPCHESRVFIRDIFSAYNHEHFKYFFYLFVLAHRLHAGTTAIHQEIHQHIHGTAQERRPHEQSSFEHHNRFNIDDGHIDRNIQRIKKKKN